MPLRKRWYKARWAAQAGGPPPPDIAQMSDLSWYAWFRKDTSDLFEDAGKTDVSGDPLEPINYWDDFSANARHLQYSSTLNKVHWNDDYPMPSGMVDFNQDFGSGGLHSPTLGDWDLQPGDDWTLAIVVMIHSFNFQGYGIISKQSNATRVGWSLNHDEDTGATTRDRWMFFELYANSGNILQLKLEKKLYTKTPYRVIITKKGLTFKAWIDGVRVPLTKTADTLLLSDDCSQASRHFSLNRSWYQNWAHGDISVGEVAIVYSDETRNVPVIDAELAGRHPIPFNASPTTIAEMYPLWRIAPESSSFEDLAKTTPCLPGSPIRKIDNAARYDFITSDDCYDYNSQSDAALPYLVEHGIDLDDCMRLDRVAAGYPLAIRDTFEPRGGEAFSLYVKFNIVAQASQGYADQNAIISSAVDNLWRAGFNLYYGRIDRVLRFWFGDQDNNEYIKIAYPALSYGVDYTILLTFDGTDANGVRLWLNDVEQTPTIEVNTILPTTDVMQVGKGTYFGGWSPQVISGSSSAAKSDILIARSGAMWGDRSSFHTLIYDELNPSIAASFVDEAAGAITVEDELTGTITIQAG